LTSKVTGAEVLFEASFPVHDTWVVPTGKVLPDVGLHVVVGDGSMASLAVATNDTAAPLPDVASCVIDGGTETVGAVLSRTVTLNVPGAEVLPASSLAVQETPVVPIGKLLPDDGVQTMLGVRSMASLALTVKLTVAPLGDVASTGASDRGTVSEGGVWSRTLTLKLPDELLLAASFAVQETMVVPTGNMSPELWLHKIVGLETVSLAVTANDTIAPPAPAAATTIVPGTEIDGAVVSWTVMVKLPDELLLEESVALHETVVVPIGYVPEE
jgi:hypothetical protein